MLPSKDLDIKYEVTTYKGDGGDIETSSMTSQDLATIDVQAFPGIEVVGTIKGHV